MAMVVAADRDRCGDGDMKILIFGGTGSERNYQLRLSDPNDSLPTPRFFCATDCIAHPANVRLAEHAKPGRRAAASLRCSEWRFAIGVFAAFSPVNSRAPKVHQHRSTPSPACRPRPPCWCWMSRAAHPRSTSRVTRRWCCPTLLDGLRREEITLPLLLLVIVTKFPQHWFAHDVRSASRFSAGAAASGQRREPGGVQQPDRLHTRTGRAVPPYREELAAVGT